jgi:hypothetical protein
MTEDKFTSNSLMLDVVDYLFVEWLVRNRCYLNFVANLSNGSGNNARERIRSHLAVLLCSRNLTIRDVFSTAFMFPYTPEGTNYWLSIEQDWIDFLEKFNVEF